MPPRWVFLLSAHAGATAEGSAPPPYLLRGWDGCCFLPCPVSHLSAEGLRGSLSGSAAELSACPALPLQEDAALNRLCRLHPSLSPCGQGNAVVHVKPMLSSTSFQSQAFPGAGELQEGTHEAGGWGGEVREGSCASTLQHRCGTWPASPGGGLQRAGAALRQGALLLHCSGQLPRGINQPLPLPARSPAALSGGRAPFLPCPLLPAGLSPARSVPAGPCAGGSGTGHHLGLAARAAVARTVSARVEPLLCCPGPRGGLA